MTREASSDGAPKKKRKRSDPQKKKANTQSSQGPPAAKKAKNNHPEKEKRLPSKKKKPIEPASSNLLIDNIMPVKISSPQPVSSPLPLKKHKNNRTLHFLSRIAEKVFTSKFENMLEKMLQRSS